MSAAERDYMADVSGDPLPPIPPGACCARCRYWAGYYGDTKETARSGECAMAEESPGTTLHYLRLVVAFKPTGPFMVQIQVGTSTPVGSGMHARGVMITDAAFGCVSFEARAEEDQESADPR